MNRHSLRPASGLRASDLEKHSVWMFAPNPTGKEPLVRPVKRVPVSSLTGKLLGTRVRLANNDELWSLIGNLDLQDPEMNEHFVTISIERSGSWFHLARYHDHEYRENGPQALADFLHLGIDEVFPIAYDARGCVKGRPATAKGLIQKEPRIRLSRPEIIQKAVP